MTLQDTMTPPATDEQEGRVRIVRYVSECDVVPVSGAMTRHRALDRLAALFQRTTFEYDLVSVETGTFVSWILPTIPRR
jgi:hypothetical protein